MLKRFFIRIHYLVTDPQTFVISYSKESFKSVALFVLLLATVMITSTTMFRTYKIIRDLPVIAGEALSGVELIEGKLISKSGGITLKKWEVADIITLISGRGAPLEIIPDSVISVGYPPKKLVGIVNLTADSIVFQDKGDSAKGALHAAISWKEVCGKKCSFKFNQESISNYLTRSRFSLFFGVLFGSVLVTLQDLGSLSLFLMLIVFLYRRDLKESWPKYAMPKIILNGVIPYFVLLPIFYASGNHAEVLNSVTIVIASIIIARAFKFHRISVAVSELENKDDE